MIISSVIRDHCLRIVHRMQLCDTEKWDETRGEHGGTADNS